MYSLKDPIAHPDYPATITDEEFEELVFWKKWKYDYFSGQANAPISALRPSSSFTNTTNNDDDGIGLVNTLLVADMLLSDDNGNQSNNVIIDDPGTVTSQPVQFGGGDFGGGGSSGTWENGTQPDTPSDPNFS